MLRVVGIGAGGHARVIVDILRLSEQVELVGLVDKRADLVNELVEGIPVLGDDELLPTLYEQGVTGAFVGVGGIGDNGPRVRVYTRVADMGFEMICAVHPRACIATSVTYGGALVAMAGAIVNPGTKFGINCVVNTGAIVDHDCDIGDHVHIAPGATLSGGVQLGSRVHIGTGAVLREGVRVGDDALVAAGAVVVRDVEAGERVAGVPARALQRLAQRSAG